MKKPKRSLYFTDRKAWRKWREETVAKIGRLEDHDSNLIPPEDYALVTESANVTFKVGDRVTFPDGSEMFIGGVTTSTDDALAEDQAAMGIRPPAGDDWQTLDQLAEWTSVEAGDPLPTRTAQSLLLEGAEIVAGSRATTHGPKAQSFGFIAAFWEVYLSSRKAGRDAEISALDVAQMMVLLKMTRANQGALIWDHFLDEASYAAVAGEIFAAQKGRE